MRSAFLLSAAALLAVATLQPVRAEQMPAKPHAGHDTMGAPPPPMMISRAVAVLMSAPGGKVQGTVAFEQMPGGVKVIAEVSGLAPGKHGFHIHEFGDCSAADFSSAGPHYMAPGESHGAPGGPTSHLGDLGNLEADASGKAHLEWVNPHYTLNGPGSIVGRAVVVHEKEDDLTTQPTGNSGARIACGVIGVAKG